jgi:hypothetical protein
MHSFVHLIVQSIKFIIQSTIPSFHWPIVHSSIGLIQVGWGKSGYVPYSPEALQIGQTELLPESARKGAARAAVEELPAGASEGAGAAEVVGARIGAALARLAINPSTFFSLCVRHADLRAEAEADAAQERREQQRREHQRQGSSMGGGGGGHGSGKKKQQQEQHSSSSSPSRTGTGVKYVTALDVGAALHQLTKLNITDGALRGVMAVLAPPEEPAEEGGGATANEDNKDLESLQVTLVMMKKNLPKLVAKGKERSGGTKRGEATQKKGSKIKKNAQ